MTEPTFHDLRLPADIETPCVVVDLDRLERNVSTMAAELDARGVRLRPHVKTHNCSAVASLQRSAGSTGLTVGTLGMAEAFAAKGFDDLFVAAPIWPHDGVVSRLRALVDTVELAIGVDSAEAADLLGRAVSGTRSGLAVLVEVDSGERRSGVRGEAVAEVAAAAARRGLRVVGAFTHGGHGYGGAEMRTVAARDEVSALADAAEALRTVGLDDPVLSAGSTPTALLSAVAPVNEERPGTYVFNDRQQVALGAVEANDVALAVAARVVSTAVPGQVVLDAGAKALSKDRPDWLQGHGVLPAFPGSLVSRIYDFHAVVELPQGPRPALGDIVAVVPNHVCPVVNLSRGLVRMRDGRAVGRWEIDGRV
jgi:D-serine deaminase-like pyridoxal phosphate-dependent protein